MAFYTKIFILLLASYQLSHAQTDSLSVKTKPPIVDAGIIPVSIYFMPDYFKSKVNPVYVFGLQTKVYINAKNAIRLAFTINDLSKGLTPDDVHQYGNTKSIKQYSVGFQHTFYNRKKMNLYFFADLCYQAFTAINSYNYENIKPQPGYIQGQYDSTMFTYQKVNSYNLTVGAGIKLLDRKPLFVSIESGFGFGYYTAGVQRVTGHTSASYSNSYTSSNGSQHTLGSNYDSYRQLPEVDTKTKGTSFYASALRIVLGVVF